MVSMNSAYIDELYFNYVRDPESVSPEWRDFFTTYNPENPSAASDALAIASTSSTSGSRITSDTTVDSGGRIRPSSEKSQDDNNRMPWLSDEDTITPLTAIVGRIAENMQSSLRVPTATSVRDIPVKVLEENRRLLNTVLSNRRQTKLSFTHILAWAIVQALRQIPTMNHTFGIQDGVPVRIERGSVNLGLAADVTRKDGTRILLVPSIRKANKLTFRQFVAEYDHLINKARTNKLVPDDLVGATVSLTNPGMIGTVMSVPRLMEGQGTIIASGSIDYPVEFQAVMPEVLSTLAVSKVVTLTSTYDHRVIQGAESGEFLQYMHQLLLGEHRFYDQIFAAYEIPFEPMRWSIDKGLSPFQAQDQPFVIDKEGRVVQMINAYRVRGHLAADINPLGLESYYYPELDPAHYDFSIWDLDREFDTGGLGGKKRATLREIIDMLRYFYCDQIGVEFMHIQDPARRTLVRTIVEGSTFRPALEQNDRLLIYRKLARAEQLESFLQTKFLGAKRFSLEGGESASIVLDEILNLAATAGHDGAVLGMAHRGRINVLANLMGKPLAKIFNEFEGILDQGTMQGTGDVKYHLGARGTYHGKDNKEIHVVLAPNPSHLEAVNPIVEGMARALDDEIKDDTYCRVVPILVHGDAAFAGQGVVAETLNMSRLEGYSTGGTIHLIINNQIGFTTAPEDSRSTIYASGMAKMLQVPILHVNGDDPEACIAAARFAFTFRNAFHDDVIIDMYCYRKYGHNEQDDPTATQPLLYKKIRSMKPVRQVYGERLVVENATSADNLEQIIKEEKAILQTAYDTRSGGGIPVFVQRPPVEYDMFAPVETTVPKDTLNSIVRFICAYPDTFNIHPKVKGELEKRMRMYEEGQVQWGLAEAIAFATLLKDDSLVRITGQDTGRGTFNHRQAIHTDIVTEQDFVPVNSIPGLEKQLHIHDSPLSEYAVLGYEYGYSTIAKNGLTIWEAQFGDFVNGAQIVIDQFISSAEQKWGQRSNLTLLLPHGYDGQGPEHSSARLERFLQLCADDNMIVSNYTTPANYFHALRRQVLAPWRKPLIIMSPKGYLRVFQSNVTEFIHGHYQEIIKDEKIQALENVNRVVFCSGKIHSELLKKRNELENLSVPLIRVEQLFPFHAALAQEILRTYPNLQDVVWVQEEPKNMGAWFFIQPLLQSIVPDGISVRYIGRTPAASPATGSVKLHEAEQNLLLEEAFAQQK